MATPIQRNKRTFPFSNSLPKTSDARGRVTISESDQFWRAEIERLHNFFQAELDTAFNQLAEKCAEIEDLLP
jgi:hypothetical protein